MKHTQGEWEVRQKVDKKGRKELCWEVTCKTNVPKMRGIIATVGYKPNAKLIAAAPELLEALKNLSGCKAFKETGKCYQCENDAKQVIEKAEKI